MECVAAYACHGDLPVEIRAGEGLLGQCAIDQKRLVIEAPDESFWKIRSGLGETLPVMVLIEPILLNEMFIGVTELSTPKPLDEAQQNGLSEMIPILAMNLEILRRKRISEVQLTTTAHTISERESAKSAERISRLSLDYEQRLMQLKQEVNEMAEAAGQEPPYASILIETAGDHQLEPSPPEKPGATDRLEHEA
jgi:hypothetical protein